MSAIGGVVDFKNGAIDFSILDSIRKSMALRGSEKSSAYIDGGMGMFFNSDEFANEEQPILSDHRGYKNVFLLDSPFLDGKAVLEKYCCFGVDFLGLIEAPFSLALYDSERRLCLLARDREGRKPLFYTIKNGVICFASEAKGILGIFQEPARVNRNVLSSYFTSLSGIYGASDIYYDVYEVRAGECILFTDVGMSRFFFRENIAKKKICGKNIFKEKHKPYDNYYDIEKKDIVNSLSDSLIAFDIPQFHSDMPMICKLFSSMKKNDIKVFKYRDYFKKDARRYSYEIEDRLGNFFGVLGLGVVSRAEEGYIEQVFAQRRNIYNILLEVFCEKQYSERDLLYTILGRKKTEYFLRLFENNIKKEDAETRIRILGMLCQLFEWNNLRKFDIVGNEEDGDYMFFDMLN